jgi:AraC-like DNA-binding protein
MRSALRTAPDERTESDLLGLLRALVVGARAGDARSQLRAAQSFIERHLTDRDLSAGRVAAAVGISERQVSRVFGEYGGVARWITDRRLDLAGELLAAARPGAVTVGDVARRCGFASQSYFARAFRQRFARTPLEVLRTFPPSA